MAKQRYMRTKTVKVEVCEWCELSHEFPVEIIFEEVEAMGLATAEMVKNETHDVVFTCPTKGKNIVVSVPVSLYTLQTFIRIQPKR